jgi:hypothetical protein
MSDGVVQAIGFRLELDDERREVFHARSGLDGDGRTVWACRCCDVPLSRLEQDGHALDCVELARLVRTAPRPSRRHIVSEWPGLRDSLAKDPALVGNALEVVRLELVADGKRRRQLGGEDANGLEVLRRMVKAINSYQRGAADLRRLVELERGGNRRDR